MRGPERLSKNILHAISLSLLYIQIVAANGGEGFEVKAKAVEEDASDQVVNPQVVAQ